MSADSIGDDMESVNNYEKIKKKNLIQSNILVLRRLLGDRLMVILYFLYH